MLIKLECLATVWWKENYDNMLSRFHLILERHGQTDGRTDGRTDGQNCYMNIARQMQVVYEKLSISTNIWLITAGWSRVITIWRVYYSLSHVSRRPPRPCGRYKQYPLMNSMATQQSFIMQTTEATLKTSCPNNNFWPPPPIWRPLKISAPKVEKTRIRDRLYHHANFHADRREICPRAKIHIFLIGDSPWGLPSHAIHFWKALIVMIISSNWHVTLQLTVFALKETKFWILGFLGVLPQKGKSSVRDRYVPCKISCRSVSPSQRYLSPDKKNAVN